MILDAQNQFSDSQAVTASAVGTNVISLINDRAIGTGEPMTVMFNVEVAADQTSGDEDYIFEVEYASNAAQSTGRQQIGRRIFESGTPDAPAQNADLLIAGFRFYIDIPKTGTSESELFLGIRYVTAGTSPSITVSAHLIPRSFGQAEEVYADNSLFTS